MSNTRTLPQIAKAIKTLEKRTIHNVIEIGKLLHEASEKCEHGEYKNWLKSEFSWSDQTALNYRHVYNLTQKPNSLDFAKLNISISAVYFVVRMVRNGQCPESQAASQAAAKAIIAAAKKDRVTYPIAVGISEKYVSYVSDHQSYEAKSDVTESDETKSDATPEPTADSGDVLLPLRPDDKVGNALCTLVACVDEDWTEASKTKTRVQLRQIIGLLELAYTARVGDDPVKSAADRAEAKTPKVLMH